MHRPAANSSAVSALFGALVDDLGVDDVVLTGGRTGRGAGACSGLTAGRGLLLLRLRVERAADLLRDPGDLLLRRLDGVDVRAAESRAQLGERLAELVLLLGRDLVAVLREELLGLVLQRLGQ